jgi:hypothetical protein
MLIERPPVPRYGEIEVDGMKYKFRVKKSTPSYAQVVLLNYVTEEYVKELIKVPKNLTIGALVEIKDNHKVCLLRSEVKPPAFWGKAYHYSKRRRVT